MPLNASETNVHQLSNCHHSIISERSSTKLERYSTRAAHAYGARNPRQSELFSLWRHWRLNWPRPALQTNVPTPYRFNI